MSRYLRNFAFVVLLGACLFAHSKVQAFDEFCPEGCDCSWGGGGGVVDCWLVFDCESLYPTFCDDFYWACSQYCSLWSSYSCDGINGCYGECGCLIVN